MGSAFYQALLSALKVGIDLFVESVKCTDI